MGSLMTLFHLISLILTTSYILNASDTETDAPQSTRNHSLPLLGNPCEGKSINLDQLIANGPCENTVKFCQDGQLVNLACPSALIFNPISKFCERPEDFMLAHTQQSFIVEQIWNSTNLQSNFSGSSDDQSIIPKFLPVAQQQQPFIGQVGNIAEDQSGQRIPSVFIPVEQQPFVGQIGSIEEHRIEQQAPSVFLPVEQRQQPFVGQIDSIEEHRIEQQAPSVFLPVEQRQQPFVGQIDSLEEHRIEQQAPSVFLPVKQRQQPFVGQVGSVQEYHNEEQTPMLPPVEQPPFVDQSGGIEEDKNEQWAPLPSPVEQQLQQQLIDQTDGTVEDKNEQRTFSVFPPAKLSNKLVDHFKSKYGYKPKISLFAPLDATANSGHDSFNVKPNYKPIHSSFAAMSSPVDLGHDVFMKRYKRSANKSHDNTEMCQKLFAEQLANRTFQQKKSSGNDTAVVECIHNEIPSRCTPYYLACVNGHRVRRHCPFGLFINPATERCERRAQIAICTIQQLQNSTLSPSTITIQRRPSPIIPTYAQFYPEKFCSELPDGLYRHPKNCSRILQCFATKLFEYPSCQHDLAFNQQRGVCDYRTNVPECLPNTNLSVSVSDECADGHHHGDHIKHPEQCSLFFRCVWGRMVTMSCPRGTVFNPQLSVCGYPTQVPNCQAT